MKEYLLITAVGPDRPGLVSALTGVLSEAGCNLEDASMTRLRSDFAMLVLAKIGSADPGVLKMRLESVGRDEGLEVFVRRISKEDAEPPADEGKTFLIVVYGADHPGIVHGVTRLLAERGATITDLRTAVAGTQEKPIYIMQMEALAPLDEDIDDFKVEMQKAGMELGVDVDVQLLETAAL